MATPPNIAPSVYVENSTGGGGGNTVAPTNAGTSGTQANGVQGVTNGIPVAVTNPVIGLSPWQLIPSTGSATTPVSFGTKPSGAVGVELYLPAGSSVNANIDTSGTAAAAQITSGIVVQYDYATLGKVVQINLGTSYNLYESVVVGAPYFRWM